MRANQEALEDLQDEMSEDEDRLGIAEAGTFLANMRRLAQEASQFGNREDVTTANLASIMFLAEEAGKKILMTGDGAGQDIITGLKNLKKLDPDGRLHVDILKVQHHGATANIDLEFLQTIIADHYVFCGNGSHHNPETGVLKLLADARLSTSPHQSEHERSGEDFFVHFNYTSSQAGTDARISHMTKVEDLVRDLVQNSQGQMNAKFHTRGSFEIKLE